MTPSRRIVAALTLAVQPLALNVLSVFATAFIIRRLGPFQYGIWAVATSLTTANAFLASLGMRPLFVRALAQSPERRTELLSEQLTLRLLLAMGAAVAAIGLCLAMQYPRIVLACVGVSVAAFWVLVGATVLSDVLQACQRFHTTAVVNFLAGLVLTALSVLVAWRGAGPIGLALAYTSAPLCMFVLFAAAVRREGVTIKLCWKPTRFRELLRDSRSVAANQFVATIRDRAEELIVPRVVGILSFGMFASGLMPALRMATVGDGIATAFYPAIARSLGDDDRGSAEQHVAAMMTVSLVVMLPLAMAVSFSARLLAAILFPANSDLCRGVMTLTAWAGPFLGLAMAMNYSLQAAGRHSAAAHASIWASLSSAVASALVVYRFGVVGAAWAWTLRSVVLVLALAPGFLRHYPGLPRLVPVARIGICAATAISLLWVTVPADASVVATIAALTGGLTLYAAGLIALNVIRLDAITELFGAHAKPVTT